MKPTLDFLPIHDIPPIGQVFSATILITKIISMFPYIIAHNRVEAFHNRIVLVCCSGNLQLPLRITNQPNPATAKALAPCLVKLFSKVVKAAKGLINRLSDRASGLPPPSKDVIRVGLLSFKGTTVLFPYVETC